MKRSEKKILSKQRILNAALEEFSKKSYDSASINTVCLENGISKGIIYHYFKDKDDIYLQCVALCFENLTAYIKEHTQNIDCSIEKQLQQYFDARIRFFAKSPIYLGIFSILQLIHPRI